MESSKPLISLVFPMYFEEGNVQKLYLEVSKVLKNLTEYEYEMIFVNDGSTDNTQLLLEGLADHDSHIKIIQFARNYGHQIAVTAGQDVASGDAVIIMDSDLQDPPSVIAELIKKWEEGADIVYAKRRTYKTNPIKKFFGWAFYRILKSIANVDIPVDTGDFRLLSQRVNNEMKKYKEKSRYLRGMTSLMGFKSDFVEFDRGERFAGITQYPFKKSLKLALDGITGYSTFPLKFITKTGILLSISTFIFGFGYIIWTLISGKAIIGWLSLMSVVMFFFGVTTMMIGILGEYIGRIYTEVLDRPLYTVTKTIGIKSPLQATRQRIQS
jgi:polyisoprenyl-phosphate glycosyltransferase